MKYAATVFTIIMTQVLSVMYLHSELGEGYSIVFLIGMIVADIAAGLTLFCSYQIKKILTQTKD